MCMDMEIYICIHVIMDRIPIIIFHEFNNRQLSRFAGGGAEEFNTWISPLRTLDVERCKELPRPTFSLATAFCQPRPS